MRRLQPVPLDLLAIAALFMLPLAFFWQVTLGGRTLLPADNLYQFQPWAAYRSAQDVPDVPQNMVVSDLVLENLQWKQFIRQSLANGEIPLWNPYLFAGVPFLAAGQHSALYPFSLIYYVMPLDRAYGWFTVSQLWLAGTFMYLFMRGLGIGRAGSMIAAIAFQMSSFFLASVVFQMIIGSAAWLPFLLLMVEFTIRRRPVFSASGRPAVLPWVAFGALGLGMTILAGHVEFVYYTLLVMGFWAAWRLVGLPHPPPPSPFHREGEAKGEKVKTAPPARKGVGGGGGVGRLRHVIGTGVALIAMVVLGIGIGAVQFVPLVELANASSREGRSTFDQIRGYAFPPRHALAFLMPNFFGSPAEHEYFDVFTGQQTRLDWTRPDGARVTDTAMPGGKNYVEGACYVGILTLILAAAAMLSGLFERNPMARIRTQGPYRLIFATLGVISVTFVFGLPTYAILYYGLPGFNQLHSPFRWVFPLTLCLAALAGFGAEALLQVGRATRETGEARSIFTRRMAKWLGLLTTSTGIVAIAGLIGTRVLFEQVRGPITSLYHGLAGADLTFPTVEAFYSALFRNVLILGIVLVASGLVVWGANWIRQRARRQMMWAGAAIGVLALDLIVATAGFNPAADPKWLDFTPPAVAWLQAQNPQEWRFTTVQGPTATMNANVGWRYRLQDIRGYDSIIPRQYVNYMEQIQPQSQLLYNRIAPIFPDTLDALNSPLLNELAVRYIITEIPLDTVRYPQLRQVYQDEAVRIYENSRALPRVSVIDGPDNAKAALTEVRFNQIMVNVKIPVMGGKFARLVLRDSYAPGWRAYIRPPGAPEDQEQEVPVTLYRGNFRAVAIERPGEWMVRFRYSPPSFQIGAFATFLALVALLFGAMVWAWRSFLAADAVESSGVRRFAKNSLAPIALNLFNRLIDLAFALIMLRLLGPANAGTYYYAVVIFGWFDIITNFGLNTLLTREAARDRAAAGKLLLNSTALRLGLAILGVPLLIGFLLLRLRLDGPNSSIEPLSSTAIIAIVLLYVGLLPNSISTGLSALFYAFEKAEIPAAISTVTAILKAAFGLVVLVVGWGVIGLAGVSILLNVITLALLAWSTRGLFAAAQPARSADAQTAARLDGKMIRFMLGAGWPLMLNHLLATIFFKIDVVLLEPLQGSTVVGQYSTAYKWVDALGVIPSLFTMALLPIVARQAVKDRDAMQRSYHFAVKLMFGLALPTAIATTFMAEGLINILGGARFLPDGAIALQLMIWFIPIGWINSLTNYVLIALDQQGRMRWAFLAGVGFNILANLIFIPMYSYRASAVVTIFSEAVLLVGFYILLRRALAPVPWAALLWKPVAAGVLMTLALALLWPISPLLGLIVAAVAYPVALVVLRPFDPWELNRLGALLPGRLRRRVGAAE